MAGNQGADSWSALGWAYTHMMLTLSLSLYIMADREAVTWLKQKNIYIFV